MSTKDSINRDFEKYAHLSELDDYKAEVLQGFFHNLLDVGLMPRSYDPKSIELFEAARVLHKHLCTLDKSYYADAEAVKLIEFANAYAKTQNGLRELG
jgi:hypothetical protein